MHVAVVAEAHVRATHAVAAGGERIIVTSGPFFYQDFRMSYISFVFFIRQSDGCDAQNISRLGGGARDPECAARRAGLGEGPLVWHHSRDEESRTAAWVDNGYASERRVGGIGGGL